MPPERAAIAITGLFAWVAIGWAAVCVVFSRRFGTDEWVLVAVLAFAVPFLLCEVSFAAGWGISGTWLILGWGSVGLAIDVAWAVAGSRGAAARPALQCDEEQPLSPQRGVR